LRSILGIILLLLSLAIALTFPVVQTKIGTYVTNMINEDYGTDIHVEQVAITVFGGVNLKQVMIRDHHKDTLIYAHRLKTNILSFRQLYNGSLLFGDIYAGNMILNMKIYKNEKESNLDRFIRLFNTGKPAKGKFLLKAAHVNVIDGRFVLSDMNLKSPKTFDLRRLNTSLDRLQIKGPVVSMFIKQMAFNDHRGLRVKKMTTDFTYSKTSILLKKLDMETANSYFQGDIALNYNKEAFKDFNNKVSFDIDIRLASLATNDIRYFYKELGEDRKFLIQAQIKGTLNNFTAKDLDLVDNNSVIKGDVTIRNLLTPKQGFSMSGDFDQLSSDYHSLTRLLPNILGKKLPSVLAKLGHFRLRGKTDVSTESISADFYMSTAIGNIQSDLTMTNIDNIDNASYVGNVILENFNLGLLLNTKEVGTVTLNADIDGKGFTEDLINTKFNGDIYRVGIHGYNYTNIVVNGNFKKPSFTGTLVVNDPNLLMDFDGAVNLSKKEIFYDFHTKVDYANLVNLKINAKDSISIFKGDVRMQVSGSSLDELRGDVFITQTSYQNNTDTYLFDDFSIKSSFDENNVKTIFIDSPDIIRGKMTGKFEFSQLAKMAENSLGSLYANYSPNKIKKGHYLRFDFTIYNKIVEIFAPGISFGPNTNFSGAINSDTDDFKLNFASPSLAAFETEFDSISIRIDNKNPLYNAYVEMDSIKTKFYKVSDFSLLNVTANDTLFVRSEFKGGNKAQDYYNLNLYHTIDENRNSVVGIDKSELKFKDFLWYLNEQEDTDNKIIFDKSLKNFEVHNVVMSHDDQKMELNGKLRGATYKEFQLAFHNIDLSQVTPAVTKFKIEGDLNGTVNFLQDNNIFKPTAALTINQLNINNTPLGRLGVDIRGDDTFKKFFVNAAIDNDETESFTATGEVNVDGKETYTDLDIRFDRLNLGSLSSLGGEAFTNITGFASGTARIDGNIKDPTINGRLFLDESGITIPYLNVRYELENRAVVDVTESLFIIRNPVISDPKHHTSGNLNGRVRHDKLTNWQLDLDISSERLLALDTEDSEDAAYYGTAFINGRATITGPATGLFIKVSAESESGTDIKIPINDAQAVGTNSYITFITEQQKYNLTKGIVEAARNYNGLELEFDFDITPDAEVEVILDRNTGHGIKGRGYGSLLFKINTLGKFNMWGDFQAYEGIYNFKYGGLIDKKLNVKKGGSIIWEGDPLRAVLNLEAVYKTTANPAVLLENASFNRKVPVEVVVGIRGNLSNPEPEFDINFPTVSSVLESEIQYKLQDRDTRQTQALYLLSSGGFLSPEGVNQSDLAGNFFERASGLFNDIFQDEDGKFIVGVDYTSADRRPGLETDGRFGFTVSTKVNERITINGKVGVPVGGINESAIVGDVEVQYRVNEDGTLNLRVFNRENDINYIGQGIGYTQGIGLSYEVDFDTFKEFVNRVFKNMQLDKLPAAVEEIPDSEPHPDYLNFPDRKPEEVPVKINSEAVPEEDN
jgi:hypothetical protein